MIFPVYMAFLRLSIEITEKIEYNISAHFSKQEDHSNDQYYEGHHIGDILDVAPQTAPIFLSIGMHCLGCPSSRGETVEEACMVHGIDVDKLLALVNEEANKAQ